MHRVCAARQRMASWLTDWRRFRLRSLLASTCSVLAEALSVLPGLPTPLRAAGFGFTLARITVRSSRTRFAGRLNSGVSCHGRCSCNGARCTADEPLARPVHRATCLWPPSFIPLRRVRHVHSVRAWPQEPRALYVKHPCGIGCCVRPSSALGNGLH